MTTSQSTTSTNTTDMAENDDAEGGKGDEARASQGSGKSWQGQGESNAGGATSGIIGGTQSITGAGNSNGRTSRCGSACWRYLSSNPRLRKGLAHAGLVLLLCFYTAAGASVRRVAINKTVLVLYSVRRVRSMVTAIYFPLFPEPDENGDNREFIPSSVCL